MTVGRFRTKDVLVVEPDRLGIGKVGKPTVWSDRALIGFFRVTALPVVAVWFYSPEGKLSTPTRSRTSPPRSCAKPSWRPGSRSGEAGARLRLRNAPSGAAPLAPPSTLRHGLGTGHGRRPPVGYGPWIPGGTVQRGGRPDSRHGGHRRPPTRGRRDPPARRDRAGRCALPSGRGAHLAWRGPQLRMARLRRRVRLSSRRMVPGGGRQRGRPDLLRSFAAPAPRRRSTSLPVPHRRASRDARSGGRSGSRARRRCSRPGP